MTPYDGSDPYEHAAGWLLLILFLSTVGASAVYGVGKWALWELFGPWGPLGWVFG